MYKLLKFSSFSLNFTTFHLFYFLFLPFNLKKKKKNDSSVKEQLSLLKYELKEKDLDIVQLQKEINELQLDNKMLKARVPLSSLVEESYEDAAEDELENNHYVRRFLFYIKQKKI